MDSRLTAIVLVSFFSLIALRRVAIAIDLVDRPSDRKHHFGTVPVVGGIAIFITISWFLFNTQSPIFDPALFVLCSGVLVLTGAMDDRFDLSVKSRLLVQLIVTILIFNLSDIQLVTLGDIGGFGELSVNSTISFFITFLAVASGINAFNMVDGIDGLLSGQAIITCTAIAVLFFLNNDMTPFHFCLLVVFTTLPFMLLNLGIPFGARLKIFMGDAGSMFLGFTIVCLLLSGSQTTESSFRPVTALWLVALPLMDMVAVIIQRVRKGLSPFRPDRQHLHHLCLQIGLNTKMTLLFICCLSVGFAAMGIAGEIYQISESIMFISFILMFAGYYTATCTLSRFISFPQKNSQDAVNRYVVTRKAVYSMSDQSCNQMKEKAKL